MALPRDVTQYGFHLLTAGVLLLVLSVYVNLSPALQRQVFLSMLFIAAGVILIVKDIRTRGLLRFLSPHTRHLLTTGYAFCFLRTGLRKLLQLLKSFADPFCNT